MKLKILLLTVLIGCIYFACQKQNDFIKTPEFHDGFVDSAVNYLKSQISSEDFNNLNLSSPQTYKNEKITIAVSFKVKNEKDKFVFIGKDTNNNIIGNWSSDTKMGSEVDGILKTESFDGKEKSEITYTNGKVVKLVKTKNGKTETTKIKYPKQNSISADGKVISTVVVSDMEGFNGEGYNNLPDVTVVGTINNQTTTYYSLYWINNGNPSYLNSFTTTPPSSSGGQNNNIVDATPYSAKTLTYESNPGIKLADYLKCFNNVPSTGATYSIKLCVDLPVNSNPIMMVNIATLHPGHTFITLTKTNGSNTVTQSFGFYPQHGPLSLTDMAVSSEIQDNANHEFNASIVMNNISALDFNTTVNMAQNHSNNMKYDLNDYNCTDYALQIFNSIRPGNQITVPDWYDIFFDNNYGTTPNGLYQVLNSLRSSNSNIQVGGIFNAPPSKGPCQ